MQCSIFHTCCTFFSQTVRPILSHPGQAIQSLAASIFASFSRVSRRDLGLLTVSSLTGGIVVALFMRTFSKPGTSAEKPCDLPPIFRPSNND
jgi:hypothetical protein